MDCCLIVLSLGLWAEPEPRADPSPARGEHAVAPITSIIPTTDSTDARRVKRTEKFSEPSRVTGAVVGVVRVLGVVGGRKHADVSSED